MAISKFSKVNSLFKTTLSSGIQITDTTLTLQSVPTGNVQYPNWIVAEPDSANAELIYLPTAPTGNTYSGIIRGVSLSLDTDTLGTGIAHAANVDIVMSFTHRQWNDLVSVMQGTNGTGFNTFRIGDDTTAQKRIYFNTGAVTPPFLEYDTVTGHVLVSNDGVTTFDISAGGSGVTSGLGVSVVASLVNLDPRTSGGLRNNQGTGSRQADVDPTIVARLDTANTWTGIQSLTAANAQITTPPSGANDAVNKTYADSKAYLDYGDGSDGDVTISSPTTLTRDMYYNNLILNADINAAGYRVFWKATLTRSGTAKININGTVGGVGGAGSGSTGGAAGTVGTALSAGTMPGGVAGTAGGAGGGTTGGLAVGVAGTNGSSQSPTVSANAGTNGGAGASVNNGSAVAGGTGGTGAAVTTTKSPPRNSTSALSLFEYVTASIVLLKIGGQSAGGGGGAAVGNTISAAGGGGGGSGSSAGFLYVAGKTINVTGTSNLFEAVGGAGGAGGAGSAPSGQAAAGGGGGGAGGSGGVIFMRYSSLTGTGTLNTSVAGGTGGAAGTSASIGGATVPVASVAGAAGPAGVLVTLTSA